MAITWKTRAVRRNDDLPFLNSSLRSSMAMRKVLRRIALGKKANYYLKDA